MGERALQNRVLKLKELERKQDALQKQIDELKDQIKRHMEQEGVDELQAGSFLVRWKTVISSRFDAKTFQEEHKNLYSRYMKQSTNRRFTIV